MKIPHVSLLLGITLVSALLAAEVGKDNASDQGRVPFPKNYQTAFQEIRASNKTGQTLLGTIYASPSAAAIKELPQLPYPNGSVVIMEWAQPVKGANGELLTEANGNWKKGAVTRVDVMRREKDFGAAYGEKRAGEWEFASYTADGTPFSPAPDYAACAECHAKAAPRDFVFRGRFPAMENK
jgi:hypothetical protein